MNSHMDIFHYRKNSILSIISYVFFSYFFRFICHKSFFYYGNVH